VCTFLNALFSLLCCGFKLLILQLNKASDAPESPLRPSLPYVVPYTVRLYVSLVRRRLAQEGEFLTFIYRAIRFDWMGASAAAAATTTNDVPVRCDAS